MLAADRRRRFRSLRRHPLSRLRRRNARAGALRQLHPALPARQGRHGRRLQGLRRDPRPHRRAQGHAAVDRPGPRVRRAVPAGSPRPRGHQPPPHRPDLQLRRRQRPALHRHGTRRRQPPRPPPGKTQGPRRGLRPADRHPGHPRSAGRQRRRHDPRRHQARQHPLRQGRQRQGRRFRARPLQGRKAQARRSLGHALLRRPRSRQRPGPQRRVRHLFPRRHPLPRPHRRAAVQLRDRDRHRPAALQGTRPRSARVQELRHPQDRGHPPAHARDGSLRPLSHL